MRPVAITPEHGILHQVKQSSENGKVAAAPVKTTHAKTVLRRASVLALLLTGIAASVPAGWQFRQASAEAEKVLAAMHDAKRSGHSQFSFAGSEEHIYARL
jgi:hypothetical protein